MEILFRGISLKTGQWVYGELHLKCKRPHVHTGLSSDYIYVKTVGQYIGRRDNNQARIFKGDRISDHNGIGIVEYSEKYAGFRVNYGNGQCKWFYDYLDSEVGSIEIIGNIHENPELLA